MWSPNLTEEQRRCYLSRKRIICAYGSRGGGKTVACEHRAMRHLWRNNTRLAIITKTTRQGEYGVWGKFCGDIFREWSESRISSGHAEFGWAAEPRRDSITKVHTAKIRNRFGNASEVVLFPVNYAAHALEKLLSTEWGAIWISEGHLFTGATVEEMKGAREIFDTALGQIRLDGVPYEETFIQCDTNVPRQPTKHWLYDVFFRELLLGTADHPWPEDWDEQRINAFKDRQAETEAFRFSINGNIYLKPGLRSQLIAQYATDPDLYARFIESRWVDGVVTSIFKKVFSKRRHVIGKAEGKTEDWEVIAPTNSQEAVLDGGLPLILVGWDPGDVNHSVSFVQPVYFKEVIQFRVLDELVITRSQVSLEELTGQVMEKMQEIEEFAGFKIAWRHFADSSVEKFRAAISRDDVPLESDLTDAAIIESASNSEIILEGSKYVKNPGWVRRRANFIAQLFKELRLFISANCSAHVAMAVGLRPGTGREYIASDQDEKHPFDSLSYAISMFALDEIILGGGEQEPVTRMISG